MKRLLCLAAASMMTISPVVVAGEGAIDSALQGPYPYQMQLADSTPADAPAQNTPATGGDDSSAFENYQPPLLTRNKFHEYLGLGSLGLATVALFAPKERHGLHEYSAKAAAALGGAAVASGLVIHWDDIHLSYGLSDPDNAHALLASLGAAGFLVAVSKAPKEGHAGAGMLGYAAMAVGIRIVW